MVTERTLHEEGKFVSDIKSSSQNQTKLNFPSPITTTPKQVKAPAETKTYMTSPFLKNTQAPANIANQSSLNIFSDENEDDEQVKRSPRKQQHNFKATI